MSKPDLSAGDYIAAKCTKCKQSTNHTIVAMVGAQVAKVQCNTCGSSHKYYAEAKQKAVSRQPGKARPRAQSKIERGWEELISRCNPADAIPYSIATPMSVEMLIQHPSFGLGQVLKTIKPNKMEVHFQTGVKLLRCKVN